MVNGAVSDEPAGVIVDVSLVDATTDVSVVGNDPGIAAPFAFTPCPGAAAGAVVVDETTDASSVGNRGDPLAGGAGEFAAAAIGEGSGFCGKACSPARFAFSSASC